MFHFFRWISGTEKEEINLDAISNDITEYCIEEIAINKAIDMYANIISTCEFQYFDKGNISKDGLYYILNIRPNLNENATLFWHSVITKLFQNCEALIFQGNAKDIYLADSFNHDKSLYYPDKFTNLNARGISLGGTYFISNVIYLKLNSHFRSFIASHYKKLGRIVDYAVEDYRQTNGRKFKFTMPTNFARKGIGNTVSEEEIKNKAQDYVDKIFKKMFESFNAVLPLQSDEQLEEISKATGKSVEEIQKAINTVYESVAIGMNIPVDIFFGKTTEKSNAMNDWITLGLKVIFEQIEDELNAKIIQKEDYLKGSRITINKIKIKHRDLLDSATDIDKLQSNGITLNEVFDLFGMPLDKKDPLADKRRYTKNYATSDELMKGGE